MPLSKKSCCCGDAGDIVVDSAAAALVAPGTNVGLRSASVSRYTSKALVPMASGCLPSIMATAGVRRRTPDMTLCPENAAFKSTLLVCSNEAWSRKSPCMCLMPSREKGRMRPVWHMLSAKSRVCCEATMQLPDCTMTSYSRRSS